MILSTVMYVIVNARNDDGGSHLPFVITAPNEGLCVPEACPECPVKCPAYLRAGLRERLQ